MAPEHHKEIFLFGSGVFPLEQQPPLADEDGRRCEILTEVFKRNAFRRF